MLLNLPQHFPHQGLARGDSRREKKKKCLYNVYQPPTICYVYFMGRTYTFKTLDFISDIKSLTYGLNIVYSIFWPPF